MFEDLEFRGFQVEFHWHAKATLGDDFPDAAAELETALVKSTIPIREIIAGGGGESKGAQRLPHALAALGWPKFTFIIEKSVNAERRQSLSHEIDPVRTYPNGTRLAIEIEWNNKHPFHNRNIENLKRLHAVGAIWICSNAQTA